MANSLNDIHHELLGIINSTQSVGATLDNDLPFLDKSQNDQYVAGFGQILYAISDKLQNIADRLEGNLNSNEQEVEHG